MQNDVRGFTLLEVLVALAIFAVASVALLAAQNSQLRTDGRLTDKTMAHWAALNRLADMQLQGVFPDIGQGQSSATMGDREWLITTKVEGTPSPDVRRITFSVAPKVDEFGEEAGSVTELTAFLPRLRVVENANR